MDRAWSSKTSLSTHHCNYLLTVYNWDGVETSKLKAKFGVRLCNCSLASIKVGGVLSPQTHLVKSYRQIYRNSATRDFGYKWPMKMESVQKHLENEHSGKTATESHQLFSFTQSLGMRWDKTDMGNSSLWVARLRMLLACSLQPERKLEKFWHPLHPCPKKFSTGVHSCCCVKMSL